MDKNEAGVQDVIAKIEKFSDTYRAIGKQLHELITTTAPTAVATAMVRHARLRTKKRWPRSTIFP